MGAARPQPEGLDGWFRRRRTGWLRSWRLVLIACWTLITLHAAVCALLLLDWLVFGTPGYRRGWLSSWWASHWYPQNLLVDLPGIMQAVLALAALVLCVQQGRWLLQLPEELVAAVPSRELYSAARRAVLSSGLDLYAWLMGLPAAVYCAFELIDNLSSVPSQRSYTAYWGSMMIYHIDSLLHGAVCLLCAAMLLLAIQLILLLRWPRLAWHWHLSYVLLALLLYVAVNSTLTGSISDILLALRNHPSWAWDALGFTASAAGLFLPGWLVLHWSARAPLRFSSFLQ